MFSFHDPGDWSAILLPNLCGRHNVTTHWFPHMSSCMICNMLSVGLSHGIHQRTDLLRSSAFVTFVSPTHPSTPPLRKIGFKESWVKLSLASVLKEIVWNRPVLNSFIVFATFVLFQWYYVTQRTFSVTVPGSFEEFCLHGQKSKCNISNYITPEICLIQ